MDIKQLRIVFLFAVSTSLSALQSVQANPNGATVVNGQVSFSQPDLNTLIINNSANAIINWQQFDIGANELTKFIQQNGSSAVLNRVVSGDASEILGKLQSNGKVFLINPNGLIMGQNAVIDTAGFIGSTLNISNDDFLNGRLHFEGQNAGDIDNQGFIRAGNNGDILLIAPNINNSGVLQVDGGNILLAAGESITISSLDDADISFEVQSPDNSITNLGQIIADNGAASLFAGTLTHSGSISANGITRDAAGNIRLVAQGTNWIEGEVIATGKTGGDIQLLGEQVGLAGNVVIDASGTEGGGQILIGGDYQGQGDVQTARATYIGEDVQIKADAVENGDGGKVIVWSDESTRMYGGISARGGVQSGDGGFIETSGGWFDLGSYVPDASAANGEGGTWLIDPNNIDIISGTGTITSGPIFTSGGDSSTISINQIIGALAQGNDVTVQTGTAPPDLEMGNITWNAGADLDISGLGVGRTLTLSAHNDVIINANINGISNAINESINLVIEADSDISGGGGFTLGSNSTLDLGFGPSAGSLDVSASTNIILDGIINTNGGVVNLTSTNGSITQAISPGGLEAATLNTNSAGDTIIGGATNAISNFSAQVGNGSNVTLTNGSALNIAGIKASGGTVKITNNGGAINQTTRTVADAIIAASLEILADNNVSLENSSNDVGIITASTNTVSGTALSFRYTDIDDLEVQNISLDNTNPSIGSSFLKITTGGDMSLNGNIKASGGLGTSSGVTLNAQNGSKIIYQSGTISADTISFQSETSTTTTGAVGSLANPVHTSASGNSVNINLGYIEGPISGGDLFLLNTSGDLSLLDYQPLNPSILHIENIGGSIDLQNLFMTDSSFNQIDLLTAASISLKARDNLILTPQGFAVGAPRFMSTVGDILLESLVLNVDGGINSAGNVELHADVFNINTAITAKNQVVIREYSATGGLEINDARTQTTDFARLTSTDLSFLEGTDLGIVLGNDLAHSGTKTVQVISDIDSSTINGPALTLDTTNNGSGSSTALINANIDFTADNENLIFTGNGTAIIQPTTSSGDITIDTGTGNFTSQVSQLSIVGVEGSEVTVKTNNADITSNLVVGSATLAGSAASFQGNNLTVSGDVNVIAAADTAEILFLGDVDINSAQSVNVSGGTGTGASAKLIGGNIDIVADTVIVSGGQGDFAVAEIGSLTGGSTTIDTIGGIGANLATRTGAGSRNASKGGDIVLVAGTGIDADALITAGGGSGVAILNFGACQGCDNQLTSNPVGNGVSDAGVFAQTVNINNSGNLSGNLNPIPELQTLFNNFTAEYVVPVVNDEEDDDNLLVCR